MIRSVMENLLALQTLEFQSGRRTKEREAEIEALRKTIPDPILGHFDRLLIRGKKGVAIVRHSTCTACHLKVPLGVLVTLGHGDDVQLCGNCGRYLYLPKDEPIGSAPADAKPAAAKPDGTVASHGN